MHIPGKMVKMVKQACERGALASQLPQGHDMGATEEVLPDQSVLIVFIFRPVISVVKPLKYHLSVVDFCGIKLLFAQTSF